MLEGESGKEHVIRKEADSESSLPKFLSSWRKSKKYQQNYEEFYAGKQLAPDTTEQEKQEVFEQGSTAKNSLIDFAEHDIHFKYDHREFSQETQDAVKNYLEIVRYIKNDRKARGAEEIKNLDIHRSIMHGRMTEGLLEEGYVPNRKIGRCIGRLILIDKGLDSYGSARRPDEERALI